MTQFNPSEHLMQIKNGRGTSDYLEVKWRLVWFREQCPDGTIDTEEVVVDLDREVEAESFVWNAEKRHSEKVIKHAKGYARYKAVVTNGRGGRATATKSENAASFADFIEKAETGAVGRALAMLGYGTQFTGDELAEHDRIVDSPVERQGQAAAPTAAKPATPQPAAATQQPRPASAPARSKDPRIVMIEKAKSRVEGLDMIWDDVKRDTFRKTIQDSDLTVVQVASINGVISQYEQNKAARTAKAS